MADFLYNRGKGAKRRTIHIAVYNKSGEIAGSWCGRTDFNTSINLPLGLRLCKACLKNRNKEQRP